MPPTLRLFAGPDAPRDDPAAPSVTVTLGDLLGACVAPSVDGKPGGGRAWISDFADEPVRVTPDLAELLHASRAMNAVAPPAPALRAA